MRALALAFVVVSAWGASSASAAAESLWDIYNLALRKDPTLQVAKANLTLGDQRVHNSLVRFFPRAYAQYDKLRTRQRITESENTIFNLGTAEYASEELLVSITQPLFDLERVMFARRERAGRERALAEFIAARQELLIKVVRRYLEALAAQKRVALLQTALEGARREMTRAQVAVKDGLVTTAELQSVESTALLAKAELAEARAAFLNALEAIGELVETPPRRLVGVRGVISVVRPRGPMDQWVQRAVAGNSQLRAQNFKILEAEKERDRLLAQSMPKVELVGTYDKLERGGSEFGGGSTGDDAIVTLRVRVPIFNQDGNGYEYKQAETKRQIEAHNLDRDRRRIVREVRSRYRLAAAAPTKVRALRRAIVARRAVERDTRQLQQNGLRTLVDVLNAQRERLRAERDTFEAELRYLLDLLGLISLSDGVTEEHIRKINSMLVGGWRTSMRAH